MFNMFKYWSTDIKILNNEDDKFLHGVYIMCFETKYN